MNAQGERGGTPDLRPKPVVREDSPASVRPMHPKQLRRLHALWRRWVGSVGLSAEADRRLRHYYIGRFTNERCSETRLLREAEAAEVIRWLARLVRHAEARQNYAAGTAGRKNYPEQRSVPPNPAAWRALWRCAAELGMQRAELEAFIRRHYAGVGLRSLADLRSMADLNRVLWGLKAMLRHGSKRGNSTDPGINSTRRAA